MPAFSSHRNYIFSSTKSRNHSPCRFQLEYLLVYEIILLPIILFHHSNINLCEKIDKALRIITVAPHMHRLHHSDISQEADSNYSCIFSIWDRIFHSFTVRPIENNFNVGLGKKFTDSQWNSYTGMMFIPFIGYLITIYLNAVGKLQTNDQILLKSSVIHESVIQDDDDLD